MFKVQRTGSKMFVTGDYKFCADIARQATKQDKLVYIIYEARDGKWHKCGIIGGKYEAFKLANGYEIKKKDGKRWLYLSSVYLGVKNWVTDYLYSKKYKTFKAAANIINDLLAQG